MYTIRFHYPNLVEAWDRERLIAARLPQVWYERTWLYAGVGILTGIVLELFIWRMWGYVPPLWFSISAALCYFAGFLFDMGATHLHISQKRGFDERGLEMPTCEANPLLPAYPTLLQQIFNISTLLSLLYIPLTAVMPGVGFGAALLHGLAGMGNFREHRRCLLTLQLFDDQFSGA